MRLCLSLIAFAMVANASELPIVGISHVNFLTSDLEKARQFYGGLLGYESAFQFDKADGSGPSILFYKVNDEQFIEVSPGLKPDQDHRMTHVSFQTSDAVKAQAMLAERALNPTEVKVAGDGNKSFRVKDPDGNILEFTEYLPGGMHTKARGKAMPATRISQHLMHAGIVVTNLDAAIRFYRDQLGLKEFWRGGPADSEVRWINLRLPGTRGDYIELMISNANPTREQLGSMQHICLEVPDVHAAHDTLMSRANGYTVAEPKIGRNRKWQLNLYDPDGSRTELMEPKDVTPPGSSASGVH